MINITNHSIDNEIEEAFIINHLSQELASYKCLSTLPVIDNQKQGEPFADSISLYFKTNSFIVVAVADGCNWGLKSKDAAKNATSSFIQYFKDNEIIIKDSSVKECASVLRKALDHSNMNISKGKELWDCGTCSFIGGIIVKLKEDSEFDYAFVSINVGNIKAYICTPQNTCIPINELSTIDSNSGSDICGRIGPYNRDGSSDLRNLEKYMVLLKENDILFFLTSGLDLNFDPREIGQTPKDCGIDQSFLQSFSYNNSNPSNLELESKEITWQSLNTKDPKIYSRIIEKKIENISKKLNQSFLSSNSLSFLPSVLSLHASQITQNARHYMEANPLHRVPSDKTKYPGFMDHASCLAINIGNFRKKKKCELTCFIPLTHLNPSISTHFNIMNSTSSIPFSSHSTQNYSSSPSSSLVSGTSSIPLSVNNETSRPRSSLEAPFPSSSSSKNKVKKNRLHSPTFSKSNDSNEVDDIGDLPSISKSSLKEKRNSSIDFSTSKEAKMTVSFSTTPPPSSPHYSPVPSPKRRSVSPHSFQNHRSMSHSSLSPVPSPSHSPSHSPSNSTTQSPNNSPPPSPLLLPSNTNNFSFQNSSLIDNQNNKNNFNNNNNNNIFENNNSHSTSLPNPLSPHSISLNLSSLHSPQQTQLSPNNLQQKSPNNLNMTSPNLKSPKMNSPNDSNNFSNNPFVNSSKTTSPSISNPLLFSSLPQGNIHEEEQKDYLNNKIKSTSSNSLLTKNNNPPNNTTSSSNSNSNQTSPKNQTSPVNQNLSSSPFDSSYEKEKKENIFNIWAFLEKLFPNTVSNVLAKQKTETKTELYLNLYHPHFLLKQIPDSNLLQITYLSSPLHSHSHSLLYLSTSSSSPIFPHLPNNNESNFLNPIIPSLDLNNPSLNNSGSLNNSNTLTNSNNNNSSEESSTNLSGSNNINLTTNYSSNNFNNNSEVNQLNSSINALTIDSTTPIEEKEVKFLDKKEEKISKEKITDILKEQIKEMRTSEFIEINTSTKKKSMLKEFKNSLKKMEINVDEISDAMSQFENFYPERDVIEFTSKGKTLNFKNMMNYIPIEKNTKMKKYSSDELTIEQIDASIFGNMNKLIGIYRIIRFECKTPKILLQFLGDTNLMNNLPKDSIFSSMPQFLLNKCST